jgi:endonuclease/exonuclease/phosphatase family metal-dependent hydrolase
MKIGTYNIWNDPRHFDARMEMLKTALAQQNLDILALQEVRDESALLRIQAACGFQHILWRQYPQHQEGLALLSRYSLQDIWVNWDSDRDIQNSRLMCSTVQVDGRRMAMMNVHLDWQRATSREREILHALAHLDDVNADYKFILGDFNCYPEERLYRFLTGMDLLQDRHEWWIDLPRAYCLRAGGELRPTLDFINNPRWKTQPILTPPGRYDWILLEDDCPVPHPALTDYYLMGTEEHQGITPSDHYGVVVQLDFSQTPL